MGVAVPPWLWPLVLGAAGGLSLLRLWGAPLVVLVLSVVFARLQQLTPHQSARWLWPFGLGFFSLHLQWLFFSLNTVLGAPAGLLVMPLIALLAAGLTLTLTLTQRWTGRLRLVALPAAWLLFDWLRTLGPLAFPWGSLGYAASRTPAVQLASLGGIPLLAALVLGSAALLAHRRRWSVGLALALWATALLGGLALIGPERVSTRTALLVQGAVDPLVKLRGEVDATRLYRDLTRSVLPGLGRAPDVVLWPEGAIPIVPDGGSDLGLSGVPLLTGAPTWQQGQLFNSAYALSKNGRFRYDKVRTVPFGETFPSYAALSGLYRPVFAILGIPDLRNVSIGTRSAVLRAGPLRYAVSLCYESVFPGLVRRAVLDGGQVLATLSNDAWFGRSAGAEQHFLMGRVRAIEFRRFWLRAGNDGVTAVTDPYGRVQARLERGARATLQAGFSPQNSLTLYARFGDWMVGLVTLTLLTCFLSALDRKWLSPIRQAAELRPPRP